MKVLSRKRKQNCRSDCDRWSRQTDKRTNRLTI